MGNKWYMKYNIMLKRGIVSMLIFSMLFSLTACGGKTDSTQATQNGEDASEAVTDALATGADVENLTASDWFSDRDFEVGYDESESAVITLNGTTASCDSESVYINDGTVTITDEGIYILSGELDDGMVIVDAEDTDKIQLVLDGVTIQSSSSAAIYVRQADKVFVTMAADTENTLSNGGEFTAIDDNNIDAVIFSKDDITLNGSGTLHVSSTAGHGIVSKDSLRITSGSYVITCAGHGLAGKDEVCIANASFQMEVGKDGIHAENDDDETLGGVYIQSGNFDITAEGDGISGATDVQLIDGQYNIKTGAGSEAVAIEDMQNGMTQQAGNMGGHGGMQRPDGDIPQDVFSETETGTDADSVSTKGIKAGNMLIIGGGTYALCTEDDALHSNVNVMVNGGSFEITSGDDAIHAEETLSVTDGKINIAGCYEGLEGLSVEISGGEITLIARDDGFNAAGGTGGRDSGCKVVISGGTIGITAGGDGIDANGSLSITGGYTTVCGPTQGDTATLDYDTGGTISGGTFIGTGASSMAQTFSDSAQGVITVNVENQSAQTIIDITDSDGQSILTWEPELSYGVVIFSGPELISGEVYTVTCGSYTQTVTAQ
ncbi:MAG: carbohydrate-binding domain-containing protein [Wujia sp.]